MMAVPPTGVTPGVIDFKELLETVSTPQMKQIKEQDLFMHGENSSYFFHKAV